MKTTKDTHGSSSKRKSKRAEERERQLEIKRNLTAANAVPNYLQPPYFHAFSSYSRNGLEATITDMTNDTLSSISSSRDLREWMFDLTKRNMQQQFVPNCVFFF
eukprot:TRINITY_DN145_c0_g2_i2.p2 TRINITY_DN145_c0_g2~~TRINITY_DN145_c0_g2_i2.p2  ORF type:complete len:104 (+),score=24.87 TRINITY_DN145_c0_g2_i2:40-351(+)